MPGPVSFIPCTITSTDKDEQRAGPTRPQRARARMAREPPGRASTGHRACLTAQARPVGRFSCRAGPKGTRPNSASGRPMAQYMKNTKFNTEFNKT